MAVFKSTLSSFAPLTERPYTGRMIEALFAIVGHAETISPAKAPQFDPEDDIELEIRTRTANILAINDVLDGSRRSRII